MKLVVALFTSLLLLYQGGCARLPWDNEIQTLGSKNVLVIFRILCEVDGVETKICKGNFLIAPNIITALANLETGAVPVIFSPRVFTPESAEMGWMYYVLQPGLHYVAFGGQGDFPVGEKDKFDLVNREKFTFWRIDVPAEAQAIYTGTIKFKGYDDRLLFFEDKECYRLDQGSAETLNQSDEAKILLRNLLPTIELSPASIMVPQTSTFILRSPRNIDER